MRFCGYAEENGTTEEEFCVASSDHSELMQSGTALRSSCIQFSHGKFCRSPVQHPWIYCFDAWVPLNFTDQKLKFGWRFQASTGFFLSHLPQQHIQNFGYLRAMYSDSLAGSMEVAKAIFIFFPPGDSSPDLKITSSLTVSSESTIMSQFPVEFATVLTKFWFPFLFLEIRYGIPYFDWLQYFFMDFQELQRLYHDYSSIISNLFSFRFFKPL